MFHASLERNEMERIRAIVIVDHADRLHEGVTNCRTDKLETALQQILAERVRFRRMR